MKYTPSSLREGGRIQLQCPTQWTQVRGSHRIGTDMELINYLKLTIPSCTYCACAFVFVSVCLSVCLSACRPVCLSASLPLCLSACLPVCLSACQPVCLSACLPVCLSACLPVCLSACLPACLPASLPPSLPPACLPPSLPACLPACLSVCLRFSRVCVSDVCRFKTKDCLHIPGMPGHIQSMEHQSIHIE